MIYCYKCRSETKVTDTRGSVRSRECLSCKTKFRTSEEIISPEEPPAPPPPPPPPSVKLKKPRSGGRKPKPQSNGRTIPEMAKKTGLSKQAIQARITAGWPEERWLEGKHFSHEYDAILYDNGKTIRQMSEESGVSRQAIHARIKADWPMAGWTKKIGPTQ